MASLEEAAAIRCAAMRAEDLLETTAKLIWILIEQMGNRRVPLDLDRLDTWSGVLQWVGETLDAETANLRDSLVHDTLVEAKR